MNYVENPLSLAVFESLFSSGMAQKLIPHCSWERHLSYKATSLVDTGEYICQLLTRIFMALPYPSSCTRGGKQCVPFSENAFLHQLQNHKETGIAKIFLDMTKWCEN